MKLNKKIHTLDVVVPNCSSCDVTTDGHTFSFTFFFIFSFNFSFDDAEDSCEDNEEIIILTVANFKLNLEDLEWGTEV
jgi:hypothetical protein